VVTNDGRDELFHVIGLIRVEIAVATRDGLRVIVCVDTNGLCFAGGVVVVGRG